MIRDIHPGSDLDFFPIPGVKKSPNPGFGSATLKKCLDSGCLCLFPFSFYSRIGFLKDPAPLLMEVDPWESGSANPWVKISVHCFLHIF